jgi:hypothetical protein
MEQESERASLGQPGTGSSSNSSSSSRYRRNGQACTDRFIYSYESNSTLLEHHSYPCFLRIEIDPPPLAAALADPLSQPQSQQQQKQKQASPPSAAAGTSSSAGASPAAVTPVPVAAFDDPEFVHGDPISFQCLLCQRQFKAIEELRKHNKLSQLHKAHFLFETRKHDASHLRSLANVFFCSPFPAIASHRTVAKLDQHVQR